MIRARLGSHPPQIAIVLGSGLGGLAERIEDAVRIPYREIPGFPEPAVAGHRGELVAGALDGKGVIAQSGRFHLYEGHSAEAAALPVRVFAAIGVRTVLFTNAAGGIRRTLVKGGLMLIADQLNLTTRNSLWGPLRRREKRCPDMRDAYDPRLREIARTVARERSIALEEGVYAGLLGPSYETPAEIRMLDRIGADAVGMSTVCEVIVARALGLRCLGISAVTNMATGISPARLTHEEVMEAADRVRDQLAELVEGIVVGA